MSWRRLGVLVEHLPADAATSRAVLGDRAAWTQEHELLASIYDSLRAQLWQAGGKVSAPKPKPFPRPGQATPNRMSLTPKQTHARLMAQRRRNEEVTGGSS